MTHIYIIFSDRIPFVNIEIVTLFVKKSRNNNILLRPNSKPVDDRSNERIRICLFLMNRWGKKNLSTLNSITKMNIRVDVLCFALEMTNILFYFHLTSHEMVYRHAFTRIETFKVRVVILFSHTRPDMYFKLLLHL